MGKKLISEFLISKNETNPNFTIQNFQTLESILNLIKIWNTSIVLMLLNFDLKRSDRVKQRTGE